MQQINLYLPEFQPNREPLRSVHMLWGALALLLLLLLASYLSNSSNKALLAQVETQRAQLEQLKKQSDELTKSQPQTSLAVLEAEALALRTELDRRERLVGIVSNTDLGNSAGFSGHLRAMSHQALDTIALDVFSLSHGGNYAEFAGKTTAGDQIPLYLQRLRAETPFARVAFGVLNIVPSKKNPGLLEFSLSQPVEVEEEGPNEMPKTAVQMLLELNEDARSKN